jgi:hypothetical protein
VKHNRLRTQYILTSWRAVVAIGGKWRHWVVWRDGPLLVHRSKRTLSIGFHGPTRQFYPWGRWGRRSHADFGMDLVGVSLIDGVHFYDVADADGLLGALEHPPAGPRPVRR